MGKLFLNWIAQSAKAVRVVMLGMIAGAFDRRGAGDAARRFVLKKIAQERRRDQRLDEVMGSWSVADLANAYSHLISAGGGRWVRLHYLPVSTLCYAGALRYYLQNEGSSWETLEGALVPQLVELFEKLPPRSFAK